MLYVDDAGKCRHEVDRREIEHIHIPPQVDIKHLFPILQMFVRSAYGTNACIVQEHSNL